MLLIGAANCALALNVTEHFILLNNCSKDCVTVTFILLLGTAVSSVFPKTLLRLTENAGSGGKERGGVLPGRGTAEGRCFPGRVFLTMQNNELGKCNLPSAFGIMDLLSASQSL